MQRIQNTAWKLLLIVLYKIYGENKPGFDGNEGYYGK